MPVSDEELVVEAAREGQETPNRVSSALAVIPIDDTLAGSTDLGEVLGGSTGAVVRRLGGLGDFSAVSLRGSSFRQVQIFLDGLPLNPEGSDAVSLTELPLAALDRVEVYRSNPPPSFGASPVGGVVNLVTRQDSNQRMATLMAGSHGTFKTTLLAQGSESEQDRTSSWLLSSNGFATRGDFEYFSDNGTLYNTQDDAVLARENNDKGQWDGLFRWRTSGPRGSITLLNATLNRQEGVPGPGNRRSLEARLDTLQNLFGIQAERKGSSWSSKTHFWRHDRSEFYNDENGEIGTGSQWNNDRYATTGLRIHNAWAPLSSVLASATLSARQDRFSRKSLLSGIQNAPLHRASLSATMAAEWWGLSDQLRLSSALQVATLFNKQIAALQEVSTGFGQEASDSLVYSSPRMGVLWQPLSKADWIFKATVGQYFRAPGLDEIFGDRGAIQGNSELVPESGLLWDVGSRLSVTLDQWVLTVEQGVFRNHAENKIVLVQNSQRTSVPVNFGEALVEGSETALSFTAWSWLNSQTNLTLTRSKNLSEVADGLGKQLPRVPQVDLHQATYLSLNDGVQVGHRYSWTDGNFWDVANVFLAPPRAYHSAFVRVSYRSLSMELSGLNLLDQTVTVMDRNPFSEDDNTPVLTPLTDFLGYPLPGRSLFLEVSWRPNPPSSSERNS